MGLFDWTGAGQGQSETPVSRSRWFDWGNARVNAEDKNEDHRRRKSARQARRDARLRNKPRGFFY